MTWVMGVEYISVWLDIFGLALSIAGSVMIVASEVPVLRQFFIDEEKIERIREGRMNLSDKRGLERGDTGLKEVLEVIKKRSDSISRDDRPELIAFDTYFTSDSV